ncbi:MAG: hypothetical protein V1722_01560, partial [Candidatus Micrarchaeota archaeon]
AVIEMPLAHITRRGSSEETIVTIWKKNTVNLEEFLKQTTVPQKLKERACLSASRQLAKLHAAGFLHSHPRADNFVATDKGEAYFVDYTLSHSGAFPGFLKLIDYKKRGMPLTGVTEARRALRHIVRTIPKLAKREQITLFAKALAEYGKHRIKEAKRRRK